MLTINEFNFLHAVAHHEYTALNGSTPECAADCATWLFLDDFAVGMTTQQAKGILSSLKTKGFVTTVDEGSEEAAINVTEAGFTAYTNDIASREEEITTMKTETPETFICPACNREFASQRGVNGHIARQATCREQIATEAIASDEAELIEAEITETELVVAQDCLCGCGQPAAKKRNFLPGHDMKLKSQIKRNIKAGGDWTDNLTLDQTNYANQNWVAYIMKATELHTPAATA